MIAARVAGVLVLALLVAAPPARASEVSAAQLKALAARAVDDPGALAQLRQVDSVDGRAVDIRGALAGASGAALDARLRQLAASVPVRTAPASRDPRQDAREVLAQPRFHSESVPGPFRRIIHWLGKLVPDLKPVLRWLDKLLPGPRSVVWLVLGAAFAGVAWFIARRFLTTRISAATEAARAAAPAEFDPKALERQAAEAEAAGDLETALRLRFRAGLLRLDERGAIEFRPSISTYEVRRALRSDDFDGLAATFDDVVYGGREAVSGDVAEARERWPKVVQR